MIRVKYEKLCGGWNLVWILSAGMIALRVSVVGFMEVGQGFHRPMRPEKGQEWFFDRLRALLKRSLPTIPVPLPRPCPSVPQKRHLARASPEPQREIRAKGAIWLGKRPSQRPEPPRRAV